MSTSQQDQNEALLSACELKKGLIPQHVAIVMDGNRRYAKKQGLACAIGHRKGAQRVSEVVNAAAAVGIKALTLYSFSTENWLRSSSEIALLMDLLEKYIEEKLEEMVEKGVRLDTIGDLSPFPAHIQRVITRAKEKTAGCKTLDLILALNYGARDEICRATRQFAQDCISQKRRIEDLNEMVFASYLDTANWSDPELLIRTSGEMRLSNFLLWQISYSEVYITKTLWPEFTEVDLYKAIVEYQNRKRRFGK